LKDHVLFTIFIVNCINRDGTIFGIREFKELREYCASIVETRRLKAEGRELKTRTLLIKWIKCLALNEVR